MIFGLLILSIPDAIDPANMEETRNTDRFANYEADGQSRCEEHICPGPRPDVRTTFSHSALMMLR